MQTTKLQTLIAIVTFVLTTLSCGSGSDQPGNDTTSSLPANTQPSLPAADSSTLGPQAASAMPASPIIDLIKNSLTTDLLKDDLKILTENDRKFVYSEADINGDGANEIFVGMKGGYFCGNAGCTVYLLTNKGKEITKFTIVDGPIEIGAGKTKDWNDLIIPSRGIRYLVRFNGKTYPSNPSVQPKFTGTLHNDVKKVLTDSSITHSF